mmetsp:Transcript_20865/g.64464  ORF Transcript_20865/g.64464 Transcript_20865/m.64464 type:complete len:403 (-) Transcript_20865:1136-2344(-)
MGNSCSSNYAQALAWFIVRLVLDRFEAEEACYAAKLHERARNHDTSLTDEEYELVAFLLFRHKLCLKTGKSQFRVAINKCYTDDPLFLVRCWRSVCMDIGLLMAVALKRESGCVATWLGHHHFATDGILVIQEHKCLRAVDVLRRGLRGEAVVEEWRDNNQLLQHLLVLRDNNRRAMYGLWNCCDGLDSNQRIPVHALQHERDNVETWIKRLLDTPAVPYASVCTPAASLEELGRTFNVYTDAAGNDCPQPALGGYLGGWYYWSVPLGRRRPAQDRRRRSRARRSRRRFHRHRTVRQGRYDDGHRAPLVLGAAAGARPDSGLPPGNGGIHFRGAGAAGVLAVGGARRASRPEDADGVGRRREPDGTPRRRLEDLRVGVPREPRPRRVGGAEPPSASQRGRQQ